MALALPLSTRYGGLSTSDLLRYRQQIVPTVPPRVVAPVVAPTPQPGVVARPMVLPTIPTLIPEPRSITSADNREQFLADKVQAESNMAVARCDTCQPVIRANAQPISTTPTGLTVVTGVGGGSPTPAAAPAPAGIPPVFLVGGIILLVVILLGR